MQACIIVTQINITSIIYNRNMIYNRSINTVVINIDKFNFIFRVRRLVGNVPKAVFQPWIQGSNTACHQKDLKRVYTVG